MKRESLRRTSWCAGRSAVRSAGMSGAVRRRTETAITNEVYCKVLCHNICCLGGN